MKTSFQKLFNKHVDCLMVKAVNQASAFQAVQTDLAMLTRNKIYWND